jgi:hypothetical protein
MKATKPFTIWVNAGGGCWQLKGSADSLTAARARVRWIHPFGNWQIRAPNGRTHHLNFWPTGHGK